MVCWILVLGVLAAGFGFVIDALWGKSVQQWKRTEYYVAILMFFLGVVLPLPFTLWCFTLHILLEPLG